MTLNRFIFSDFLAEIFFCFVRRPLPAMLRFLPDFVSQAGAQHLRSR
jgi:hypothetical protein